MIQSSMSIFLGFLCVLVLTILPLPDLLLPARPPFVLLYILYIEYFLPGNLKLPAFILLGLVLDVLLASVIGEHSFALLFVTWIAISRSRCFQFYSMIQQIVLIGFFCLLYQTTIVTIDALLGFYYNVWSPLLSGLAAMLFWPWMRVLADDILLPQVGRTRVC